MLGEVIRRYGLGFERRHITALSRQLLDEAEHYDTSRASSSASAGACPPRRRPPRSSGAGSSGTASTATRLGAIAAWNMSETAATGTLEAIVEAGQRYDLPEVVRGYEQIIRDEKFHVGLGRLLLDRYTDERRRSRRGAARHARHGGDQVESHVAIDSWLSRSQDGSAGAVRRWRRS